MSATTIEHRAAEAIARLQSYPSPARLAELAELGLGDAAARAELEVDGGDGVGTDAYELVRDAAPTYVGLLDHADEGVRTGAAYLLAFLVEHAEVARPALQGRAEVTDGAERIAMMLAHGRLSASVEEEVVPPMDGIELHPTAQGRSTLERAAIAIEQVWRLPRFPRSVTAELAAALDAVEAGTAVGPWGEGDLHRLAGALRRGLMVRGDAGEPDDDEPQDETDDADEDIGDAPVDDPYTQQRPKRSAPLVELPGLRDVAWGDLEHAYGTAEGVPGMIEALSSPDPADRAWAIEALDASIHHQGSVYAASTAAVPFLVRLAGDPQVHDRHLILALLCGIAVHEPSGCLVNGARRWRSEAFDEVVRGGPVYVTCLRDRDPKVRTAAAFVLSFIEPSPADALESLCAAVQAETDRRTRSSLLLAIGYLSRYAETKAHRDLLRAWLDSPTPLLRTSAAIALVQIDGLDVEVAALEALGDARQARSVVGFWPWNDGDLAGFATALRMAVQTLDDVMAELHEARATGDDDAVRRTIGKAFSMALRDDAHDHERLWRFDELDARQREILTAIVATAPKSGLLPLWEELLEAGLPSSAEGLDRLLQVQRGPLDEAIVVGGETVPRWWAIHEHQVGRLEADAVVVALQALPAEERVGLVDDFLSGPYRLTRRRRGYDYGSGDDAYYHYTSAAIALAIGLLGLDAPAVQWAEQEGRNQVDKGSRRDAIRALVAAGVLLRDAQAREVVPDPWIDGLLALDQAPASTFARALGECLALLPEDRCTALLADLPMYGYTAYQDPRGEVRRWSNGRGWDYLDLMPVRIRVQRILDAWVEWERHQQAGDDRSAEPVVGHVTASVEQRPSPDADFPVEVAMQALAASGPLAIERALADARIQDRGWIEEARRRLG